MNGLNTWTEEIVMRSPISENKEMSNLAKGGNLCAILLVV